MQIIQQKHLFDSLFRQKTGFFAGNDQCFHVRVLFLKIGLTYLIFRGIILNRQQGLNAPDTPRQRPAPVAQSDRATAF